MGMGEIIERRVAVESLEEYSWEWGMGIYHGMITKFLKVPRYTKLLSLYY